MSCNPDAVNHLHSYHPHPILEVLPFDIHTILLSVSNKARTLKSRRGWTKRAMLMDQPANISEMGANTSATRPISGNF